MIEEEEMSIRPEAARKAKGQTRMSETLVIEFGESSEPPFFHPVDGRLS